MTLALLCSGQGQQHAAMFDISGEAPAAAPLFSQAAGLLGADPRAVAADPAIRTTNRAGQILCTLQTLAAFAAVGTWPKRRIVAGYSVGEVAAWSLAGLFDPLETLDLVARRAELMDEATRPGDGMLFLRGLPRAGIDDLCAGRDAAIAIINPGDAYVLGGRGADLDLIAHAAEQRGASRVQRLAIRVASHTPGLAPAAKAFGAVLEALPVGRLAFGTRLLSGVDAAQVTEPAVDRAKLGAQVAAPIRWSACLEACIEHGATAVLELGPGHALADMMAGAHPGVSVRSIDQFRSLTGVRNWIESCTDA